MRINDLIQHGVDITVAIKVGDLMLFADKLIERAKNELAKSPTTVNEDKLVSADELCRELNIKKPTLYKWQRQGYIAPVHIGGRSFYRNSDIVNINKGCKIGFAV